MLRLILSLGVGLAAVGCSKDKDKDHDAITTTRVRPPVQESLPSALLANGSFALTSDNPATTCQTNAAAGDACATLEQDQRLLCIVKNRLFCKGPTEVLNLLDSVDSRLAEIEARSSSGEVACISAAPVDLTTQMTYPGNQQLASKYQCQDSAIKLGFGYADAAWHLREANGAAGQAFKIADSGAVDGFIWMPSSDGSLSQSTGFLQIHADKTAKTMELTGGGVGFGFCGLHLKSNASNVYIFMNPDGVGTKCDFNADGTTDSADWVSTCLDATTLLAVDASNCSALKSFTLTTIGRDSTPGSLGTWEKAAPSPEGSVTVVELKDQLNSLFTQAGSFEGVSEFATK